MNLIKKKQQFMIVFNLTVIKKKIESLDKVDCTTLNVVSS